MHTARSAFHSPHSAVQEVLDRIVGPGLKGHAGRRRLRFLIV